MQRSENHSSAGKDTTWQTVHRLWHWLTAASLAGAAFLTSPEHTAHAVLGWSALGLLLFRPAGAQQPGLSGHALWPAAIVVLGLNLSGWLVPAGVVHTGTTLATLVIAALYCATVLFESLQRLTARLAS